MSAVLVRASRYPLLSQWHSDLLADLNVTQTPHLHFRNLKDNQRQLACLRLAGLPIRVFTVASNKQTMRQHKNDRAASRGGRQPYCNWIARLLLERVTDYCARRSKRDKKSQGMLKVVFATTGKHSYGQTYSYHEWVKVQASAGTVYKDKWVPNYSVLNPNSFESYLARELPGLQFADVVASAFYTAVNDLDHSQCRPRYAQLLEPRVAGRPSGARMDYGVVLQPSVSNPLAFNRDQREIFDFYGYGFDDAGYLLDCLR